MGRAREGKSPHFLFYFVFVVVARLNPLTNTEQVFGFFLLL
jgi:hypothetical protein